MATHRVSILGVNTVPDVSGNCWQEPFTILATNDVWGLLIFRFGASNAAEPTTRIGLRGQFSVPKNYAGAAKIVLVWTATVTAGNTVWDFDYRVVSGDDTQSLDQSGVQESVTVTDTAPTASLRKLEVSVNLTSTNLLADSIVEFEIFRDGTDAADTMAASAILLDAFVEYSDV